MKTLTVVLLGAGDRGRAYTNLMEDERFKVVAVADPKVDLRNYIKEKHGVPEDMCFDSWEQILDKPKFADVAIVTTLDRMHYEPVMKAIELGYDILLEKPVSADFKECVEIANAAKEKGTKILVCHVLRYTPFFGKIKEMIDEGMVGRVMSIHHAENVGNVHQSHSFVRGNWSNSDETSSMILQKCCHDMDIMQWFVDKPCKKVHSFGSLTYFTRENAPEGAPEYCDASCPEYDTCPYNAVKLYVEDEENLWFREVAARKKLPTNTEVEEALRNTQFGKCVFKCENNVVDHQVVNLEFEDGAVASFNMSAFNKGGRFIRVMGTEGEINGDADSNTIEYYNFRTKETTTFDTSKDADLGGHGGGDGGILNSLYDYIVNDVKTVKLSEIEISVKNHLIAFAAEKSRVEDRIIDIKEFEKELGLK